MIENPNVICNDCAYCKQNKELRERLKNTQELELEVRRENTKLKELLKDCRENIASMDYDSPVLDREQSILLNKICQALGAE